MDLLTFLNHVVHTKSLPNQPVICFYGIAEVPTLFFAVVRSYLKASCVIEKIDFTTADSEQAISRLYTTFLGNKQLYWLGDITTLPNNHQQYSARIVHTYTGPHTLILFSGQTCSAAQHYGVEFPAKVDASIYMQLATLYTINNEYAAKIATYDKIIGKNIQETCMLLQYISVMGRVEHHDLQDLMRTYGELETSLSKLSQYFFEKKEQPFFRLWSTIYTKYTAQFWIAFWSEQIWRAIAYSALMRANTSSEAKSIGYRLPFAFLQHGWQRCNVQELKKVHTFLCDLEYDLKNGGSEQHLDLVYLKYFTGACKSE